MMNKLILFFLFTPFFCFAQKQRIKTDDRIGVELHINANPLTYKNIGTWEGGPINLAIRGECEYRFIRQELTVLTNLNSVGLTLKTGWGTTQKNWKLYCYPFYFNGFSQNGKVGYNTPIGVEFFWKQFVSFETNFYVDTWNVNLKIRKNIFNNKYNHKIK